MLKIETEYDALVAALVLAITAPDETRLAAAMEYVERSSDGFDDATIQRAKRDAVAGVVEFANV